MPHVVLFTHFYRQNDVQINVQNCTNRGFILLKRCGQSNMVLFHFLCQNQSSLKIVQLSSSVLNM